MSRLHDFLWLGGAEELLSELREEEDPELDNLGIASFKASDV